jgi:hypothetical protein
VHVDLFDGGVEDSLPETTPSTSLAPQRGLSDADATTKIVGDKIGINDIEQQMYPILAGIYDNDFDPVDHKTLDSIRPMLSEIVHLLDALREGLKVKDFGGHDIMFVRVPHSSSETLFNNTKSWVDEALKYNESTRGGSFDSAFRVLNHLCRFCRDSFVAAMEKQGMLIAQPMSTVQYAAMMSMLNITWKKEGVLWKYMRQHLGPAFCLTQRSMSILAEGHTKVHTVSMSWIYDGKEREETVVWREKDLHTEIEVQLLRCLKSRGMKPSDVKAVQAVVGGDHCDTAFQFGAAITAEMHDGGKIYFKVTTDKLICRIDMSKLLEATILPRLTTGL